MFSVSDRISVSGILGTVRYVGPVHVWGDGVLAYGIEWDDASRGKHSGDVDGRRYFTTKVAGAASFLKASNKKIDRPRSFFDAVHLRYSREENTPALGQSVVIGSKVVQSYGFSRLNEISNNTTRLGVVMVDRQNINAAGDPFCASSGGEIPAHTSGSPSRLVFHAETLDLGYNLLTRWDELHRILGYFPHLKSVNLNGNRMAEGEGEKDPLLVFHSTISHVSLSATFISPSTLGRVDFSGVEKLDLAGNDLLHGDIDKWSVPAKLAAIDLSFNHLERIPTCLNTASLTHMVLANNNISSLDDLPVFPHIKKLDLRRNPLSSFDAVDALAEKFPNLSELRLNGCRVFDGLSAEETAFNLIGRLRCEPWKAQGLADTNCISKLNGSYLSESEITNAELYFISRVRSGHLSLSNRSRWSELLSKHGVSCDHDQTPNSPGSLFVDDRKIRLSIRKASDPDSELFSRVFLQKNTVLRLKGVIAQQIGSFILDFSVFYYVNDDDSSYGSHQVMDDDIASLQSFGFSQNHRVYVL